MVAYFNASSELFITHDLENGDQYSFRYEPYIAGEPRTDALAAMLSLAGEGASAQLPGEYTQLPAHLERDGLVINLAQDIAGSIDGAYARGLALTRYLRSNYAYSLSVPDAPENLDFVSHFLFDVKAGYCTYFASALTVLARSIGLPARYVEGFLADPGEAGSVTLSGANAHAWTEIYIQGLGWVTFDPTAGDGDDNQDGGEQPPPSPPPSPSPSPSPSPEPSQEPEQDSTPSPSPLPEGQTPTPALPPPEQDAETTNPPGSPFPWLILLLLTLIALLIWRAREETPERREKRLKTPEAILRLYWQAMLESRAMRGEGILPYETPMGYAVRVDAGDAALLRLAAAQSAMVYGRKTPEPETLLIAWERYAASWRRLPWHQKAVLSLRRALRPSAGAVRNAPGRMLRAVRKWIRREH